MSLHDPFPTSAWHYWLVSSDLCTPDIGTRAMESAKTVTSRLQALRRWERICRRNLRWARENLGKNKLESIPIRNEAQTDQTGNEWGRLKKLLKCEFWMANAKAHLEQWLYDHIPSWCVLLLLGCFQLTCTNPRALVLSCLVFKTTTD